jgi:inositol-phosphate transport system ATP-binding protein
VKLRIDGLTVAFGPVRAVDDLDLEVGDGELMAIVGPSGCGKSTTLGFVAGFTKADTGTLYFDGDDVTSLSPQRRKIGFVFQDYAIYPHLSAEENIRFPLDLAKVPRRAAKKRVADIAQLLDIGSLLHRRPSQLSGGQRQRVALARALVKNPTVLLLDEPLSNLDAHLRVQMRAEIRRIQLDLGITTLFVTHDQAEALSIADRVAIMNAGRIEALASPQEVYAKPGTLFAARFIGSPQMNLWRTDAPDSGFAAALGATDLAAARPLFVGIRPEHLLLDCGGVPGTVRLRETLGRDVLLHVEAAGASLLALIDSQEAVAVGPGDDVRLTADHANWHFFDAETGLRVDEADVAARPAAVSGEGR